MKLKILVYGAGAIGTYIGLHLLQGKHEVTFLEREKDLDRIKEHGMKMDLGEEVHHFPAPELISSPGEIKERHFDLCVLALKTYHLDEILEELARVKDHLPPLLCLQNGIKSERILSERLAPELIIPGTVTSAVDRLEKGAIIIRKSRGAGIAGDHPLVPVLVEEFNQAGLRTTRYACSQNMAWSKLILNLLGNASAAILNMTIAEIYQDPRLFRLERRQILEVLKVMDKSGLKVVDLPGVPVKLLALLFKYLPPALSHPLLARVISRGRGEKMPSFHIDLWSGKGKSEVDHLNGAVVEAGAEINLKTPVNEALTRILLQLINGEESTTKYSRNPDLLLEHISP